MWRNIVARNIKTKKKEDSHLSRRRRRRGHLKKRVDSPLLAQSILLQQQLNHRPGREKVNINKIENKKRYSFIRGDGACKRLIFSRKRGGYSRVSMEYLQHSTVQKSNYLSNIQLLTKFQKDRRRSRSGKGRGQEGITKTLQAATAAYLSTEGNIALRFSKISSSRDTCMVWYVCGAKRERENGDSLTSGGEARTVSRRRQPLIVFSSPLHSIRSAFRQPLKYRESYSI